MVAPATRTDPTSTRQRPTLVLGLGNILLRDEGIGVRVVQALEQVELPSDVELCDGGTAGLDLLDVLVDRERVLVIDALAGDVKPGTVLRLKADELQPGDGSGLSLHEIGLLETLAVAKRLGIAPRQVIVLGIKPFDVSCGLELSPELARLVLRVIELVMAELGGRLEEDERSAVTDQPSAVSAS